MGGRASEKGPSTLPESLADGAKVSGEGGLTRRRERRHARVPTSQRHMRSWRRDRGQDQRRCVVDGRCDHGAQEGGAGDV
ncbi:hypothetical protein ACCO45_000903 [Purpureocillium lilacinum]|uniref:Uncharacterized protein n=1 Tax=Purpureocillium lilacinum TaxID=33203 RepID=A0ACC4E842_PURLI